MSVPSDQRRMMRTLKWRPVTAAADDAVMLALQERGWVYSTGSGAQREWRMTSTGADVVMGRQRPVEGVAA